MMRSSISARTGRRFKRPSPSCRPRPRSRGSIAQEHLDTDIVALGGEPILKHLHQVHKRYGVVTGATKPAEDANVPGIGDSLGALLESIRCDVVALSGSVQRRKPKTRDLADELLKPLATWTAAAAKDQAPEPPPAGDEAPGGG